MDSLYYGDGCSCCHGFNNAAGEIRFSPDILAAFMRKVYHGYDTGREIEPKAWREALRLINEATVGGLAQAGVPPTHEEEFYRSLRHSNEVFAAFKVHSMGEKMAAKLTTADGKLKPFREWAEEVKGISSHYVGSWFRTEYDTAVIRAHAAADWRNFERNKDVMPNLRWMPTTSPEPDSAHRMYWQKKLTLPVEHPFWERHHPGDRWNCKCTLEQTDEPANPEVLEGIEDISPVRGLENNPGKDGHTFNDTHPYFPDKCSSCFAYKKSGIKNRIRGWFSNRVKDCYDCPFIDGCLQRNEEIKLLNKARAKEIKEQAKALTSEVLRNNRFPHAVTISNRKIKEWLNQPHEHYREKNEVLLDLQKTFASAKYIGEVADNGKHKGVYQNHLFEFTLCGDKSTIIVHEMEWGEFQIHSISDGKIPKK